jgi:aquaporin Z
MLAALKRHWPEYLIEAGGLGLFMLSASLFVTLFEHPDALVRQTIADPMLRRVPMGLAMGLTAVGLIYSPFGMRSGAHFNPAVTSTFFRLGKVERWDYAFYVAAQCLGGLLGIAGAAAVLAERLGHPAVNYVATVPGPGGLGPAFVAELAISFGLMLVVLVVSNTPRVARYTGLGAGALVATYIILEAPLSGMSMNPARTLASAVPSGTWPVLWLYVAAPLAGMLLAAEAYVRLVRRAGPLCAKLHHQNDQPCLFRCGYRSMTTAETGAVAVTEAATSETISAKEVSAAIRGRRAT